MDSNAKSSSNVIEVSNGSNDFNIKSELSKQSREAELKLLDIHREQFCKMKIKNLFENIMRGFNLK